MNTNYTDSTDKNEYYIFGSSPNLGNEIYRFDYQEFGENHETKTVQIQ
jgi:hypothetical protein